MHDQRQPRPSLWTSFRRCSSRERALHPLKCPMHDGPHYQHCSARQPPGNARPAKATHCFSLCASARSSHNRRTSLFVIQKQLLPSTHRLPSPLLDHLIIRFTRIHEIPIDVEFLVERRRLQEPVMKAESYSFSQYEAEICKRHRGRCGRKERRCQDKRAGLSSFARLEMASRTNEPGLR